MPGSLFLNKQESHEILHFSIPSKPSRAISSTQSNRACICRFVGHICTALSEFSLVFQAIILPRMGPSVKKSAVGLKRYARTGRAGNMSCIIYVVPFSFQDGGCEPHVVGHLINF